MQHLLGEASGDIQWVTGDNSEKRVKCTPELHVHG